MVQVTVPVGAEPVPETVAVKVTDCPGLGATGEYETTSVGVLAAAAAAVSNAGIDSTPRAPATTASPKVRARRL